MCTGPEDTVGAASTRYRQNGLDLFPVGKKRDLDVQRVRYGFVAVRIQIHRIHGTQDSDSSDSQDSGFRFIGFTGLRIQIQ